jgi:hypothetical protein
MESSINLDIGREIKPNEMFDTIECHFKELSEEKYSSGWLMVHKGSFVLC